MLSKDYLLKKMDNKYRNNLIKRAKILQIIRSYFEKLDYLEVHTPVAITSPAPEEYIESITSSNNRFLRCSPEIAMKILLCDGLEKIYQIGSCFRANEHGSKHREEFTMLEFYQVGINYMDLLKISWEMIVEISKNLNQSTIIRYANEDIELSNLEILTVEEAFLKYTPISYLEAEKLDIFDELMVTKIEPNLGRNKITALIDYPANRASLARLKAEDSRFAERFELYISGIELANAFGELTDLEIQRERFAIANEFRATQKMVAYPECIEFFAALERGLPESSGCALGLDRLFMIFTDSQNIADVIIES